MRHVIIVSALVLTSCSRSDAPPAAVPVAGPPFYVDKADLSYYLDGRTKTPIRSPEDWDKRREHILANMQLVMGPMPSQMTPPLTKPPLTKPPLDVRVEEDVDVGASVRRKLTFAAGPGANRVSAYLFLPKGLTAPTPGVLCLHPSSQELGKALPSGLADPKERPYAVELADRGYVTLAPDYIHSGGYHFDPYENGFESATMLGVWNHRVALDLLQSLPEVDGTRLAAIGQSLGGHNSLFLAAFDPRVKAVVSSCGFCSFPTYMKGDLDGWSRIGYMPRIRTVYELKPEKMPFDFPEVLAAIAPRAVHVVAPIHDSNFNVDGVKDCVKAARPIFALFGAADRISTDYPDAGHDFPDESRRRAYAFLDRWLKAGR